MELTAAQIQQIDDYVASCGIKFHEVKAEIVDHFATILEQKLVENSKLDIKEEITFIHQSFSKNGFKEFLKEKEKSVKKKFFKVTLQYLSTFFTIPKIIISITLYCLLWFAMQHFDNDMFFPILGLILVALGFRLLFNVNIRDTNKNNFLSLQMTMHFFNVYYGFVMFLNIFGPDVKNDSNAVFCNSMLLVNVLLFLFYWSGEYVYYQNKKEVQQQYPNVFV